MKKMTKNNIQIMPVAKINCNEKKNSNIFHQFKIVQLTMHGIVSLIFISPQKKRLYQCVGYNLCVLNSEF